MITIFTPTYNRKELLKKLYDSLCYQKNYNFEWLIVDDCSNDGTLNFIENLKSPFPIRTFSTLKNSGKHIAYNIAIKEAKGEYFICVDSDDILSKDAMQIIYDAISMNVNSIGFVYPQINEKLKSDRWDVLDEKFVDIIDIKEVYGITESAIVIKTSVLKKYLFPQNEMEKFCPETVVYNKLVKEGSFLVVNKAFYISEYQNNGITNNLFKIWLNNHNNVLLDMFIKYDTFKKYTGIQKIKSRIKCIMNLNAICIKKKISIKKNTPSIMYSFILYVPSLVFAKLRFRNC